MRSVKTESLELEPGRRVLFCFVVVGVVGVLFFNFPGDSNV